MPKVASGYVRSIPGGAPVPNIDVTVRHEGTGSPVAVGGMSAGSQNPMVTDSTGFFSWSCELSPGPIRVEAVIDASETKVRSGKEMMQAGDLFVSEVPQILNLFTSGVVRESGGSPFTVEAVIGSLAVRVLPGAANMRGRYLQTLSNRELTIAPNTTLTTRLDRVVLEQTMSGSESGKQVIRVVQGTVNNTLPAINAGSVLYQVPLATATISLNASSVTVSDARIYAGPPIADGSITGAMLAPNSVDASKIVDLSVGNAELATGAVTSSKIADSNITLASLAVNSVNSSKIVDGSILIGDTSTTSFDSRYYTEAEVDAKLVGTSGSGHTHTVTSSDILDGTIAAVDLANGAVTLAKLASNSVDSSKIVDGSILIGDVSTSSFDSRYYTETEINNQMAWFIQRVLNANLATSSTDQVSITDLGFSVVSGQVWQVDVYLPHSTSSTQGMEWGISRPSSTDLRGNVMGSVGGFSDVWSYPIKTSTSLSGAWFTNFVASSLSPSYVEIHALLRVGSSGTIVPILKNANSANTVTVLKDAYLSARRVS